MTQASRSEHTSGTMDHSGHNHSVHEIDVQTLLAPGKIQHPEHGTWPGHVLPGSFFLIWSVWWLFSVFKWASDPSSVLDVAALAC